MARRPQDGGPFFSNIGQIELPLIVGDTELESVTSTMST